tara:strand:+ start:105 stop:365 length:261 start_codon:yes stop_codon:yes gene_type:complete
MQKIFNILSIISFLGSTSLVAGYAVGVVTGQDEKRRLEIDSNIAELVSLEVYKQLTEAFPERTGQSGTTEVVGRPGSRPTYSYFTE